MRINTNVSALNAARNLGNVQDAVAKSSEKLSSGFRINHASDDAAGLGIANTLRAGIKAYTQASSNANQANSVYNIMDGAASSIQTMLERMKELAAQSASDTVDGTARGKIDTEFQSLLSEIDRTVSTTKFQSSNLLDGTFGQKVTGGTASGLAQVTGITVAGVKAATYTLAQNTASGEVSVSDGNGNTQTVKGVAGGAGDINFSKFGIKVSLGNGFAAAGTSGSPGQLNGATIIVGAGTGGTFLVGASGDYAANDTIGVAALNLTTTTLGVGSSDVLNITNAQTALTAIDTAIGKVNDALGTIGAGQNRMTAAISNLSSTIQNYTSAESTIRDVDMASEMVQFSKNNILAQAGTAMLAQANQAGQSVLKLLQ